MLAAGIGLIIIGYTLLYSGASQISTGGKGWGIVQSFTGHEPSAFQGSGNPPAFDTLFANVKPQGNSGAATPPAATPPVGGATPV